MTVNLAREETRRGIAASELVRQELSRNAINFEGLAHVKTESGSIASGLRRLEQTITRKEHSSIVAPGASTRNNGEEDSGGEEFFTKAARMFRGRKR